MNTKRRIFLRLFAAMKKQLMGESDNKLLLIDEPEAFLHPEAVRALSRSLYEQLQLVQLKSK
nr:AAA family ATPase [Fictibacillus sp. FJAT-27399]